MIAVDPGYGKKSCAGVAVFLDGVLVEARSVRTDGDFQNAGAAILKAFPFTPDRLVLEWPQIYQREGGKSKAPPSLMLPLAGLDGYLCGVYRGAVVRLATPAEWKGRLTKTATKARSLGRLSPDELSAIPKGLTHDGYDAVALGLWDLGRFSPVRVYPGAT